MRHAIRSGLMSILVGAFLLAVASPAHAQVRTIRQTGWKHGSIGIYAGGLSPATHVGSGQFDASATVGATLGFWVSRHAGIRLNGLFARTNADGPMRNTLGISDPNVWMFDGDIVLRAPLSFEGGWITPYVLGGLGGKTYNFRNVSRNNQTFFTGNYGAGLEYRLPGMSRFGLTLEVRDFVSKFTLGEYDNTQHDVVWTGGIRFTYR